LSDEQGREIARAKSISSLMAGGEGICGLEII
jgi:hypothetical protein